MYLYLLKLMKAASPSNDTRGYLFVSIEILFFAYFTAFCPTCQVSTSGSRARRLAHALLFRNRSSSILTVEALSSPQAIVWLLAVRLARAKGCKHLHMKNS